MSDVNWGLINATQRAYQLPDFVGDGIKYQQAGIADRQAALERQREEQLRGALQGYATDPSQGLGGVIAADPVTGIKLQDSQAKLAHQTQQDALAATKQQQEAAATKLKALGTFADAVDKVSGSDPSKVGQAFDQLHDYFAPAIGMDPQHYTEFRDSVVANPSLLKGLQAKAAEGLKVLAPGAIAVDDSGAVKARNPNRPAQPHYVKVTNPDGSESIVQVGGGDDGPPSLNPSPTATNPTAGVGTRGDRNNNPGNVKTPPQGPWQGQTGVDAGGYAQFDSPESGMRAADMNLAAYARHGITTPDALVERWASTSPPNEKAAYKQRILAAAGPSFDLANPQTRAAILPAIMQSEGTSVGASSPPQAAQSGGTQPGMGRVVFSTQPVTSPDAPPSDADLFLAQQYMTQGPKALSALGRAQGNGGAQRTRVIALAAQIAKETGMTGSDAVARWALEHGNERALDDQIKTQRRTLAAEDTVLPNIQTALDLYSKGGRSYGPWLNKPIRALANATGDPSVAALNAAVTTVQTEAAKILSGSLGNAGSSDASRREAQQLADGNLNLNQFIAVANTLKRDFGNRRGALQGQVDQLQESIRTGGAGKPGDPTVAAAIPAAQNKGKPYAPGAPFSLAPAQRQAFSTQLGSSTKGIVGTRTNPVFLNPTDARSSYGNIKSGQWFVTPSGELLKKS